MELPDVFVHDDGSRYTDVEALHTAELGNLQGLYAGPLLWVETQPKLFVAKDEGAAPGEADFLQRPALLPRDEGKEGITRSHQFIMAGMEAVVETGRYLAESALGGGWIKGADVDEVDFPGAEGLGAAKDFGNIESGLQVIQYQHELMDAGTASRLRWRCL